MGSFAFGERIEVRSSLRSHRLSLKGVEGLLAHYLKGLGHPNAGVGLLLCGDARSRRLNRDYRKKDKATDILSFPALAGAPPRGFSGFLGDLALDIPYAWRRRGRFADRDHFEAEAAFLLLHGLLHLTGTHHDTPKEERRMERLTASHFPPPNAMLRALAPAKPRARTR